MIKQTEIYAEQLLTFISHSLPDNWDTAIFVSEYEEDAILQYGTVTTGNTISSFTIIDIPESGTDVADVAIHLQQAMFEEVGVSPIKSTFKLSREEGAELSFEY